MFVTIPLTSQSHPTPQMAIASTLGKIQQFLKTKILICIKTCVNRHSLAKVFISPLNGIIGTSVLVCSLIFFHTNKISWTFLGRHMDFPHLFEGLCNIPQYPWLIVCPPSPYLWTFRLFPVVLLIHGNAVVDDGMCLSQALVLGCLYEASGFQRARW